MCHPWLFCFMEAHIDAGGSRRCAGARSCAGGDSGTADASAAGCAGEGDAEGEPASKPTAASSVRMFTTPAGIIINAVRPERVADFEKVLGYLQAAFSASANATVRAQAEGWRFEGSETGPERGGVVCVPVRSSGTGRRVWAGTHSGRGISRPTKLQEIWKLYTDSLASGGSLLSLTPVTTARPPAAAPTAAPQPYSGSELQIHPDVETLHDILDR